MAELNAPTDPEGQTQPEPAPEQTQPSPQDDIEQAYQRVAEHQGWDPRLTRYELEEVRRKRDELDRERQEFERQRALQSEPPPDDPNADPYMREISGLRRLILQDREERRRVDEEASLTRRIAGDLEDAYVNLARQHGMTKDQMDTRATEFFDTIVELYPKAGMIQEIGTDRAARAAFRVLSTNGTRPAAGLNRVNPRERVVMPSGSSGPGPGPPVAFDAASQRENETNEQYLERLTRMVREQQVGLMALPEGRKFTSG